MDGRVGSGPRRPVLPLVSPTHCVLSVMGSGGGSAAAAGYDGGSNRGRGCGLVW